MIASILAIPLPVIAQDVQPKKIIYETDMCADVDDAGGLAILHALANKGEAEILAVCFNEVHPYGAPAIDAMNTWYGRGDIPIGIYKGHLNNPHGSGYLEHVAEFPHDLETADAPSALDVYRQVLAEQPDSSVTIVSVGFLNNINDLLIAEPDLVARKVVELVQMAGVYNDGFNLVQHNLVSVSENVIRNWPTLLVISQEGSSIHTGNNYENAAPENPFREAFYRYFGEEYRGRPSWDEMAVLYGVYGLSPYFNMISTGGTGRLSNGYTWNMQPGFRAYLTNRYPNSTYERIIEGLMDQLPIGAYFTISANSGWVPFTVEFDASISTVEGTRTVAEYLWDFGDGSSGEGETISHEYTGTGVFPVQLTIIDSFNDTLQTTEYIRVSDPIFSELPFWGNVLSYQRQQDGLWSTRMDSGDLRYYLSNDPRDLEQEFAGFCFVSDSIYSDFALHMTSRTGEDLSQSDPADFSILFGYIDADNYSQLFLKHSSARIVSVSNRQNFFIVATSRDGIPDDHYHDLDVVLTGDQLTVFLDDSLFLSASSSRLEKTGKIGFGSEKYAMYFDDISIEGNGNSTAVESPTLVLSDFQLEQNFPNPFNPSTTIQFALPRTEYVVIEIYNSLGQRIKTLISQQMPEGSHTVVFSGEDLVSGIYFYKLQAGDFQDIKKMVLLK